VAADAPLCTHQGLTLGEGIFYSVLAVLGFVLVLLWFRSMSRWFF
jgi:hypothetical protein